MKQRVITAVIALIIFIPLIVYGRVPLSLAALVLGIIALDEVLIMKKMLLVSFEAIFSNIGVILLIVPDNWLTWLPSQLNRFFLFYVVVMLILLHTVVKKKRFTFDDAGVLTLAMLYIGTGFHYFISARADGLTTLLFAMLIVWLTDSGAYMIGKQIGKHKLAPRISPNKTWEGSIGGTVAATIILAVYLWFFPVGYSWVVMVGLTLILSIIGQFGDLIESALKRFYGVKDSGKILPGHGGILDRFDSMLLVMPCLYLLGII
ncbi:phosphatidate cytidylyltransferase [Paucilactobacillus vaccinostercus DSM 20634]|jgi:phosphatidate cytidylyltransferase|uniref:Phosphatidate cytidylyltransferase n=1 Tax=Paucilactobacillus vaccinostercus DSM 20634 TaxID=1423813 RepID=A0A0R2AFF1_9LACO|nr:phosphatidate cytidylyltransferase [Paucilactobacillus vaccinostercus]KRM62454.1 phosphatidate cytidylyltransferase [Paucilactobacillus vaccinostercus DSM 20634]RRG09629.1 MAG: phosphatidate cytidylyltransferase [Lactobacillus sp.]